MLDGSVKIDRSVPIPLYYQLKHIIYDEIKAGHYKGGDIIPTEKELSAMYGLSRTTVRQAIAELVSEGWLYRIKSKGTFVGYPKVDQNYVQKIESFNTTISRLGMIPSTEVLKMEVLPSKKIPEKAAAALNLTLEDKVIFLFRIRFADNVPIVTVRNYLPFSKCSFMLSHDFNQEQLYGVLSQDENTHILKIDRTIEAVDATTEDSQLLKISRGAPIQLFTSVGYNPYDVPIEYTISRYRGDRNKFKVTVFT